MANLISTAAATALLLSSPQAPEATAEAPASSESQSAAVARAMFERGLAAYEASDYRAAVLHWSSAYDLMAAEPALARARRVLAYDLGQAHMRAYDVDGDRSHLTQAGPLLEDYIAWVDRPAHTMSDEEREDRARAEEMLARIDILQGHRPRRRPHRRPKPRFPRTPRHRRPRPTRRPTARA